MDSRRIASMSKLDTGVGNLSINDPRKLSPSPSTKSASTDPGSGTVLRKQIPDMRTSSPSTASSVYSQPLNGPPPVQSPYLQTTQLPMTTVEIGDALMPPPPLFVPQTQSGAESPPGSRPTSRAGRLLSRPGSRDLSWSRDRSRGTNRSDSPGTRPSTARPQSSGPPALATDSKLKKRKSWLPGLSKDTDGPKEVSLTTAQAWLLAPRDKIPYDLTALLSFEPVSTLRSIFARHVLTAM